MMLAETTHNVKKLIQTSLEEEITPMKLFILYWNIGKEIFQLPSHEYDLLEGSLIDYIGITVGFSKRNLFAMRTFFKLYQYNEIKELSQLPWYKVYSYLKRGRKVNRKRLEVNSQEEYLLKELKELQSILKPIA